MIYEKFFSEHVSESQVSSIVTELTHNLVLEYSAMRKKNETTCASSSRLISRWTQSSWRGPIGWKHRDSLRLRLLDPSSGRQIICAANQWSYRHRISADKPYIGHFEAYRHIIWEYLFFGQLFASADRQSFLIGRSLSPNLVKAITSGGINWAPRRWLFRNTVGPSDFRITKHVSRQEPFQRGHDWASTFIYAWRRHQGQGHEGRQRSRLWVERLLPEEEQAKGQNRRRGEGLPRSIIHSRRRTIECQGTEFIIKASVG